MAIALSITIPDNYLHHVRLGIIQNHAHLSMHVLLLPMVPQDLGEPLAALLPYPEREQLVAVSLDGTAWVLSRPADASHAKASRSSVGGAFMWTCALRMVLAKASEDNPLAVRPWGEEGGGGGGEGSSTHLGRGGRQWKAQAHGQEERKQLVFQVVVCWGACQGSALGGLCDMVVASTQRVRHGRYVTQPDWPITATPQQHALPCCN
jgi:hypothetical protein